jgi:uncharacterized MAPEG superfamily protein
MKVELLWLTWTTILTGLIWLPYVGDSADGAGRAGHRRLPGDAEGTKALGAAHEGGPPERDRESRGFAVLVLVANAAGISNAATTFAAAFYFWSRVIHLVAYTLAWPWIRTVAFTGGFVAQAIFAWQIVVH